MDLAAFEEICCEMIERTSSSNRFGWNCNVQGPTVAIIRFRTGSRRARWRRAFAKRGVMRGISNDQFARLNQFSSTNVPMLKLDWTGFLEIEYWFLKID